MKDNVMCSACRDKLCRHTRTSSRDYKLRRLLEYTSNINERVTKLNQLVEDLLIEDH